MDHGIKAKECMRGCSGDGSENDSREHAGGTQLICPICLGKVSAPVVARCGHYFCWPCLYQWLESRSQGHASPVAGPCPTCKSEINVDEVIPLYGTGANENGEDPRRNVPPRPSPEAAAPHHEDNFFDNGMLGNGGFYFGFMGFPFMGFTFNLGGDGRPPPASQNYIQFVFLLLYLLFFFFSPPNLSEQRFDHS